MSDNSDDEYGGSDYSDDFDNISLDDYEFDDVPNIPGDGLDGFEQDNGDINDGDGYNDADVDGGADGDDGDYGADGGGDEDEDKYKIYPESTSAEDIEVTDTKIGDGAFQSVTTNKDMRSVVIADSVFQACHDSVEEGHALSSFEAIRPDGVEPKVWEKEVHDFDHLVSKCIENEKRRLKESSLITSSIAKDSKHRRAILERQLQIALNQINSYRKENAYLTRKLDSSLLYAELDKCRSQLQIQQLRLKEVMDENRSLQRVQRFQEKSLVEMEKEQSDKPGKEEARERQRRLVEKKIKSLKNQLINYQARDRLQYKHNMELKERNMKLQVKIQALALSQSIAADVRHGPRDGVAGEVGVGEAGMSMDLPSVHMSDEIGCNSMISVEEGTLEHLRSENNRLKSIVSSQRASFKQQLTTLQSKLQRSMQKRRELEEELSNREKEMKVQLMAVRELNNTCEELMRTNIKLREASTLYNRQSYNRSSQKDSQISLINARQPTTPRVPAPSPSNSARSRRAILACDDEPAAKGGNFTFMTSEIE